jgi:predicted nucleotidyltransferase
MNTEIKNIIIRSLQDYDPVRIGVFGSYAREENQSDSDIDILVRFKSTLSLLQLVHIERILSGKLGIKVDLIT